MSEPEYPERIWLVDAPDGGGEIGWTDEASLDPNEPGVEYVRADHEKQGHVSVLWDTLSALCDHVYSIGMEDHPLCIRAADVLYDTAIAAHEHDMAIRAEAKPEKGSKK